MRQSTLIESQTNAAFRGYEQLTQICCECSFVLTQIRIARVMAKLFSQFVATLTFHCFNLF